jgi:phosphoribosyl 1,2-cyclic phosphodiesterase
VRFASLGSGSEGNALIVQSGSGSTRTTIMIDCGFSQKELERRLARIELSIADLDAMFVTHEHSDHIGGVFRLGRKHEIPVYLTRGTFMNTNDPLAELCPVTFIQPYKAVDFQGLQVTPFTVPHDAREPVQYVIGDGQSKLGVLTDLGHLTPSLIQDLNGLDALVLEANHDPAMLAASSYPESLKRRISGPYGHLANETAGHLLSQLDRSRLKTVIAAHLSSSNNRAELARECFGFAAKRPEHEIGVALQGEGFSWVSTV